MIKSLLISVSGLVLSLVAITILALEMSGVIMVETTADHKQVQIRTTSVWYAQDRSGAVFLEAGNSNNPWVRDLKQSETQPMLNIVSNEPQSRILQGRYHVELDASSAGHQKIRAMMREKYGWRDWWIGFVFDTTKSELIRLEKR